MAERRWELHEDHRLDAQLRLLSRVKFDLETGCWLWVGCLTSGGYGSIRFRLKTYRAHRLAYEVFRDEITLPSVCHTCDTPRCINPFHLFQGTQSDNMKDAALKGGCFHNRGSGNSNAILTETEVLDMRTQYGLGVPVATLASQFGVCHATAWGVSTGRTWRHVV